MTTCEFIEGDAFQVLKTLADESVHCCVTSPPYFGLRDYGTATWQGGSLICDHKPDVKPRTARPRRGLTGGLEYMSAQDTVFKTICQKCGSIRVDCQIGLEVTPEDYISNLRKIFKEVFRILRHDGTLWLNLGDSYATGAGSARIAGGKKFGKANKIIDAYPVSQPNRMKIEGLKPKDLIGIPWRVALALQKDGWFLRQDIIWHKPNPMPESVRDRCTKSHEYIFLLSKSAKYFFNHEAIKEKTVGCKPAGNKKGMNRGRLSKEGWSMDPAKSVPEFRNRRSVWTVSTKPFRGAHFATFPPDLIRPCILAGSPAGGIVLDPFAGAGTTNLVARDLGRSSIGIELNPDYIKIAKTRLGEK